MMKTMTMNEFRDLAENGKWEHNQYVISTSTNECPVSNIGELDITSRNIFPDHRVIEGCVRLISTCGDTKITYAEEFSLLLNHKDSYEIEYPFSYIDGVKIIKKDKIDFSDFAPSNGDEIVDTSDIWLHLPAIFSQINHDELLAGIFMKAEIK